MATGAFQPPRGFGLADSRLQHHQRDRHTHAGVAQSLFGNRAVNLGGALQEAEINPLFVLPGVGGVVGADGVAVA